MTATAMPAEVLEQEQQNGIPDGLICTCRSIKAGNWHRYSPQGTRAYVRGCVVEFMIDDSGATISLQFAHWLDPQTRFVVGNRYLLGMTPFEEETK